jgi:hypothetical protein
LELRGTALHFYGRKYPPAISRTPRTKRMSQAGPTTLVSPCPKPPSESLLRATSTKAMMIARNPARITEAARMMFPKEEALKTIFHADYLIKLFRKQNELNLAAASSTNLNAVPKL